MASFLARLLQEFLLQRTLRANQSGYTRLVLGGLPLGTLRELFALLTQGNGSPWQPRQGNLIPIFLVTRDPSTQSTGPSRECNWDFALAVRNSFPSFVLLVDPSVWDDRTYSIINATDTIGLPLPPVKSTLPSLRKWSPLYADLVEIAGRQIGKTPALVGSVIREALKDLPSLEPAQQHVLPWDILDRITRLAEAGTAPTSNELAAECGLPPLANDGTDFRRSRRTLERLAEFLEDGGIEQGIQELQATSRGDGLGTELAAMRTHLRQSAGSASAVSRAPSFYYFVPSPRPSWWDALTAEVLDEMLNEVGRVVQPERLSISCTNAVNPSPVPGEPFIVRDGATFEARHPSGAFQSPQFLRRHGRQNPEVLASSGACPSPWAYADPSLPSHGSPITYTAEDTGTVPASVQVVGLASYVPGAFVTCPGPATRKVTKPRRTRASSPWQQQLLLRSSGTKILKVFCGPAVAKIRVVEPPELRSELPVSGGPVDLQIDVDEDVDITLQLLAADGQVVSAFAVGIAIDQDDRETAPSYFDALVRAHQDIRDNPSPARSVDSWLRRAEANLLTTNSSWSPVLATPGWADSAPRLDAIRLLGVMRPQVDPRPTVNPPGAFLEARQRVLDWLRSAMIPLPEANLANDDAKGLAVDYLRAYREWAANAPAEACWTDTIALLEREPGQYGNQAFAAHEPVAILLSPLHPIRFGWHVAAQHVLSEGLGSPCPLAGLLDPHRCLDVMAVALARSGGEPRWKSYVAISCQDAMWGLFWDAGRLRDMQQHEAILELSRAGVVPRGIQSGFTASQAKRTLEEITRVLPTRAILRMGIVSSGQGSTSCTDGLVTWCRQQFSSEDEGFRGPRSIEVYDSRLPSSQPSREEISSLADDTGHRVRWFSPSAAMPTKDLVIIDHLGLASPVSEVHPWRSPAAEGSLIRSRIRLDRNDAEWVIESRRAVTAVQSEDSLLDELAQAVGQTEGIADSRGACSHIAFTPNREVLGRELQGTRFLAVSSAEIDPACFARGTPQSGGFLWDYELPHAVGPGEQRGGFYLLAKPPDAIKRAVLGAIKLVSQSDIGLDALLIETSRRGIPILKRLAAGGSLARGELGMLLAVRLLQDAFRGPGKRVRLPVLEDTVIRMVLPVDPYVSPLDRLRQGLQAASPTLRESTRPDLLLACIRVDPNEGTQVHLVPLEVKFREGIMTPQDKATSLAQASGLGDMLHYLLRATPMSDLWRFCSHGFLSEILDHGFRVYGDPLVTGKSPEQWVKIHQACLADVLGGRATVSIAQEGRLVVFDESPYSYVDDVDKDGFAETLIVCRQDSRALLEDGVGVSQVVDRVASLLDICGTGSAVSTAAVAIPAKQQVADRPEAAPPELPVDSIPTTAPQGPALAVPPEIREHVSRAFLGFIGNRPAVDTLRRAILKALLSTPPQLPASYLFTGNPSTGKTELARKVARSLALPFVSLDGRGLVSRERLFELIDGALRDNGQQATRVGLQYQKPALEYPPLVVFIDEVHLVPRPVQESLLTALEPKDRSVLLADRVARLPQATFLFATTRPSDIDMAFRTRCTEIPLQDYTEEEVAAIVGLEHPDWAESLRRKIARYGRLVPRIALELARELVNEALVSEHQDRNLDDHLEEVRRTRLVDDNGLGRADIEYLELLEREARPLGERNILTMLTNIDKDRFLEEVEPLLVARMKLVRRTERGREITQEGRRYLLEMRRQRSESR